MSLGESRQGGIYKDLWQRFKKRRLSDADRLMMTLDRHRASEGGLLFWESAVRGSEGSGWACQVFVLFWPSAPSIQYLIRTGKYQLSGTGGKAGGVSGSNSNAENSLDPEPITLKLPCRIDSGSKPLTYSYEKATNLLVYFHFVVLWIKAAILQYWYTTSQYQS